MKRIKFTNDAERKARKAELDRLRHSTPEFRAKQNASRKTPEFRAKKNAKRRVDLRLKAAAEGREIRKARLTDEERKIARKASWLKWKNKNLETHRKNDAEKHKKNRAEKNAFYAAHPQLQKPKKFRNAEQREKHLIRCVKYRIANNETLNAKQREFYAKNKEMFFANNRKRRAKLKGCDGTHTAADIRQLYFLQHGKCAWCNQALAETGNHVDHWVPLAKGGTNDKDNLRLLHKKCNLSKGTKDPRELELIGLTA